MEKYYQKSNSQFAINGVLAVAMDDEMYAKLQGQETFFDEDSKEVHEFLVLSAKHAEGLIQAQQDAEDLADVQEALTELIKEQLGVKLVKRIAQKKAARVAARDAARDAALKTVKRKP